jgi:uncharacterized protein (DUF342 family)
MRESEPMSPSDPNPAGTVNSQNPVCAEEFTLTVSEDRMAVIFNCGRVSGDVESLVEPIGLRLADMNITTERAPEEMAGAIRQATAEDGSVSGLALVEGTRPGDSVDGRIEWIEDFFITGFDIDADSDRADYWHRLENLNVSEGMDLARVFPAISGDPGLDVFGEPVPAEEPVEARIESGPNVETTTVDDHTLFTATKHGRLRWADGILAVDDVYTIEGDADINVGNICHPGAVVIQGNVAAGAKIEAEGDIVVKGCVEPANIRASGSLTVAGGIVGSGGTRIELGGGVHAKYILEATIVACEDLEITNEIRRSSITSRGAVVMPRGAIVDSEVHAHKGIMVRLAGSDAGVNTVLVPGFDFKLATELEEPTNRAHQLEQLIKHHEETLQSRLKIGGKKDQQALSLTAELETLEARLTELRAEIRQINKRSRSVSLSEVHVSKRIFTNTVIKIGSSMLKLDDTLDGKRVFSKVDGHIVFS